MTKTQQKWRGRGVPVVVHSHSMDFHWPHILQKLGIGEGRLLHTGSGAAPPQFQQAGFGKVLVVLTPLAAGAGVVTYAK